MTRTAVALGFILSLTGCTFFHNDAAQGYRQVGGWSDVDGTVVYTTANVRLIIRRKNPVTNNYVVCTEPTPDVATAFSTATQIAAKGGNQAASGQLSFAGSSGEAISELAGRSTALLALRDGLYRACEAYANGALGANAYALILARYGQLMTTLFLGQDLSAAATAGAGNVQQTPKKDAVPAPSGEKVPAGQGAGDSPALAAGVAAGGQTPPKAGAGGGAANGSTPGGSNGAANPGAQVAGSAPPSTPGASDEQQLSTAAALVKMNEDYFDLDNNVVQLLVVACINDGDPTGIPGDPNQHLDESSSWLRPVCKYLNDPANLLKFSQQELSSERGNAVPASAATDGQAAAGEPAAAAAPATPLTGPTGTPTPAEQRP